MANENSVRSVADIFKTCSVEFIENGNEFHVLSAFHVLLITGGGKNHCNMGTAYI